MRLALIIALVAGCKAKRAEEKAVSPVSTSEAQHHGDPECVRRATLVERSRTCTLSSEDKRQIESFRADLIASSDCKVAADVIENVLVASGCITTPSDTWMEKLPDCRMYTTLVDRMLSCAKVPAQTRDAIRDGYTAIKDSWGTVQAGTQASTNEACKYASDAMKQMLATIGCEEAGSGSRDVPGEKGVPLDRAVLGAQPHPFGALQPIKSTMTRDEIIAAVPDARRDGENLVVPLGVEALVAKITIDSDDHISDIEIPLDPFPGDLFEAAWGAAPNHIWLDHATKWRADVQEDGLHIFPYRRFEDVIGAGPDGLAEKTPIVGASLAKLKERFRGRIYDWTDSDEDGNEVTKPRFLLPSTEICHYDTMFILEVRGDTVTGATLEQCYDSEEKRRLALGIMERRWGRVQPSRTGDDRLVWRFARNGRFFEMTQTEMDPEGGWRITMSR